MLHSPKSAIRTSCALTVILTCLLAFAALDALDVQAAVRPSAAHPQGAPAAASGLLPTPTPAPSAEPSAALTGGKNGAAAQPSGTAVQTPRQTPAVTTTVTTTVTATVTPTVTPTLTPTLTPTVTPTPAVIRAQVAANSANLRSGPGTDYKIVGSADAEQEVTVIGSSAAGDWYQLEGGMWIAAFLVSEPNAPVPTLPPTATPPPTPTPNAAATAAVERRANATATIAARAYTPPDGIWCAAGSERAVCAGPFDYAQYYGYYSAPAGGRLVILVLSVHNIGSADITANPNDVTLVTADGRSHPYDTATFEAQQPFEHVVIAPGDDALGALVFVTADDTAPERIIYRGGFWEEPIVVDLRKEPMD